MRTLLARLRTARAAQAMAMPRARPPSLTRGPTIGVDENGSPLTLPAVEWFVCFVPGLRHQWWHRFAHDRHKHVFAMRPLDDGSWLLVEPWWTRMMVRVLTLDQALQFLRWGASGDILRSRESVPGCGSQLRGWANCSVLVAFLLGRRYWTWTPHGLYRRLRDEAGTRPLDLAEFLGTYYRTLAVRSAAMALEGSARREGEALQDGLVRLGSGIMSALMSPPALALYRIAVSTPGCPPEAERAFWQFGPGRFLQAVQQMLEDARVRGEINIVDAAAAAHCFVSMLRGGAHLEAVFGLGRALLPSQVHARVRSAVAVLLGGACCRQITPGASLRAAVVSMHARSG